MTSIPDSVKARLDADWSGAGGTEPTYYVGEDFRTNPPLGQDAIWILSETLKTKIDPQNDTYSDKFHTLELLVVTQTSEDRLKELADEVERVLNATAITGATYQKVIDRQNVSNDYKGIWVYMEKVTVDLREQMVSSTSAYGAGAGVWFLDEDDMASDCNTCVASQQSIKAYVDAAILTEDTLAEMNDTTIAGLADNHVLTYDNGTSKWINEAQSALTGVDHNTITNYSADRHFLKTEVGLDDLDDCGTLTGALLLDFSLFGSANKDWVPCLPAPIGNPPATEVWRDNGYGLMETSATGGYWLLWFLPMAPTRGGLKLYIDACLVGVQLADASNYVDRIIVRGRDFDTLTSIDDDPTNRTAAGEYTYTFTATDCSVFRSVFVYLLGASNNATKPVVASVSLRCYYST